MKKNLVFFFLLIIPVLVSSVILFIIIIVVAIYKAVKFAIKHFFGSIKKITKKDKLDLTVTSASVETKSLMSQISHPEN